MRTPMLAWCLFTFATTAGCAASQSTPYANDPLLRYYKPTLSETPASLLERNAPSEPAIPPVPTAKRE